MPLSRAKLRRPPLVSDYVRRPGLIEHLDRGLDRTLTLVCTPAGYGKSTLLSAWLHESESPGAWLSLEPHDDSLHELASGIVEAIELILPEALPRTRAWLDGELPSPESLASYLVDEISELESDPLVLVLDDYHVLHDSETHAFVSRIIELAPGVLHLVLSTRVDPPLPLTGLRAAGRLTEIRQTDLRFSERETGEFLANSLGHEVDPTTARTLEAKTEGWPVGIRLGALSLRKAREPEDLLDRLPAGSRFVTDYLVSEVLDQQMPIIQEYLLRASVVDRFCAPLCDALLEADLAGETPVGIFDGAGFLALAERANVFLIPLDEAGHWYRFHHLFRDLLYHQLESRRSESEVTLLKRRAADWLEVQGFLTEAIEMAIKADSSLAVHLVARHRHDLMNREEWHRLDQWLRLLPPDVLESEPELMLLKAWTMENRHRYQDVLQLAHRAAALLADQGRDGAHALQGEVFTILALESYLKLDGLSAAEHAERALELLEPVAESVRGYAVILLSLGRQMLGELGEARRTVRDNMREVEGPPGTYDARLLAALTLVDWIAGDLQRLSVDGLAYLSAGLQGDLRETVGMGHYFLGVTAYERNDLVEAEDQLARVVRNLPAGDPWNLANSGFVLAVTLEGLGRHEEANRIAEQLSARALEVRDPGLVPITRAFQAELALRQGRTPEAIRWAETVEPDPVYPPYRWFIPNLTYARARMAQATADSRSEAAGLLERLRTTYESIHAIRALTDVLALQALLLDSTESRVAADAKIAEALRMAEPGGFIRMFVDLGRPMRDLLRRVGPGSGQLPYVRRILAAFAEESLGISGEIHLPSTAVDSGQLLALEITNRELEVLSLLANRLSNKEIGSRLQIGPGTVATHAASLYRKLEVTSRREAVAKAEALGILTPH